MTRALFLVALLSLVACPPAAPADLPDASCADPCGETCCPEGETCQDGTCQACTPSCTAKTCDDGCGGRCPQYCTSDAGVSPRVDAGSGGSSLWDQMKWDLDTWR